MQFRTSRRTLLFAALASAAAAAAGVAWRLRKRKADPPPVLREAPTGPLADDVVATLLAAVTALVDGPVAGDRYEGLFRFKAIEVPGYRAAYERFVACAREAAAERSRGRRFDDLPPAARRDAVEAGCLPNGRVAAAGPATAEDRREFRQFVVRDMFRLFNRNDAWLLLGYGSSPGVERGLDAYRRAPG